MIVPNNDANGRDNFNPAYPILLDGRQPSN